MKPVLKDTVVHLSIPNDMAPIRPVFLTRIFVTLICIFSLGSLFYTTVQLHTPRSHTAKRDTRTGSLQLEHSYIDVNQLDNSNKMQLHHNLTNQLPQIHPHNNSLTTGAEQRKLSRRNVTFVLPRGLLTLNLTKQYGKPQSLEEEHLILVEPRRAKLSREKAMKRKEMKALKTRTWEQTQSARRQLVKDVCEKRLDLRNGTLNKIIDANRTKLSHFLVSDRFKLIFMAVPMAASDFWKSAFRQLPFKTPGSRVEGSADGDDLRILSTYDESGIRLRLREYKKLLFVRDPFARLVSAYRRKFLSPTTYSKPYESIIAETYRQWNTGINSGQHSNISFQEFAYFVEDSWDEVFDSLWQPMSKLALPCEIKYDFIGKLEEGPLEFNNMLKSAKIHALVKYKPSAKTASHKGSIYDHYFLQLWTNQIKRLYKKYEDDFMMFGYSIPNYMYPWVFGGFKQISV